MELKLKIVERVMYSTLDMSVVFREVSVRTGKFVTINVHQFLCSLMNWHEAGPTTFLRQACFMPEREHGGRTTAQRLSVRQNSGTSWWPNNSTFGFAAKPGPEQTIFFFPDPAMASTSS